LCNLTEQTSQLPLSSYLAVSLAVALEDKTGVVPDDPPQQVW